MTSHVETPAAIRGHQWPPGVQRRESATILEIVLATTDEIDALVRLVGAALGDTQDVGTDLRELACRLLAALMQPDLLRLRRLVIANADRFPDLGRTWYERGFGRVLTTLASRFKQLADRGLLRLDDPLLAANHFAGQVLWIPMNEAMFTGDDRPRAAADLKRYADAAVHAFLVGHAGTCPATNADVTTV